MGFILFFYFLNDHVVVSGQKKKMLESVWCMYIIEKVKGF